MNTDLPHQNILDYALIIGVSDYPTFSSLKGPNGDADRFHAWLTDSSGGSVPPANCRIIQSTANPAMPIQNQIDEKFGELLNEMKEIPGDEKKGRRFYFYFSGHGVGITRTDFTLQTGLLMANFSEDLFRNAALLAETYRDIIATSGRFTEVIFFLDCCRTRVPGVMGLIPQFSWPMISVITGEVSTLLGYATEFMDAAFEAARLDLPPGQSGSFFRGHFTEALLRGLRGEAADRDTGQISVAGLRQYLERETPRVAKEKDHDQQARFEDKFLNAANAHFGIPFLTTVKHRITIQGDLHPNEVELLNGEADTVRQKSQDGLIWELDLPVGKYIIKDSKEKLKLDVKPTLSTETVDIIF